MSVSLPEMELVSAKPFSEKQQQTAIMEKEKYIVLPSKAHTTAPASVFQAPTVTKPGQSSAAKKAEQAAKVCPVDPQERLLCDSCQ
jgi:hypothetical protein